MVLPGGSKFLVLSSKFHEGLCAVQPHELPARWTRVDEPHVGNERNEPTFTPALARGANCRTAYIYCGDLERVPRVGIRQRCRGLGVTIEAARAGGDEHTVIRIRSHWGEIHGRIW